MGLLPDKRVLAVAVLEARALPALCWTAVKAQERKILRGSVDTRGMSRAKLASTSGQALRWGAQQPLAARVLRIPGPGTAQLGRSLEECIGGLNTWPQHPDGPERLLLDADANQD